MEIKELIAKNLPAIKKMLFGEEIKMEANEAKLSDGVTIVKWDGELIVGTPIMVVSEAGLTAAPDGSHELEDGRKIDVMDGLVTSVETKKEEKEEEETVEVEMKTIDEIYKDFKDNFAEGTADQKIEKISLLVKVLFEDRFSWQINEREQKAEMEKAIDVYKTGFAKVETEQKETIASLQESFKLMFQVVEALAGEPQKVEEVLPDSKTIKKDKFFNTLEEISKKLEIKK